MADPENNTASNPEALWRKHVHKFVCPKCHGEIQIISAVDGLTCSACRLRFPVQDDIPALRLDRAESY